MANKKVGLLNVKNTIKYDGDMTKPFKSTGCKETKFVYIYFKNLEKGTCTCIIKHFLTEEVEGVGISKCHPNDKFDLGKGISIAEYRAKIDQYEKNIKRIGKSNGQY